MDSEQDVSPVDNSDKWSDTILQASAYTPHLHYSEATTQEPRRRMRARLVRFPQCS